MLIIEIKNVCGACDEILNGYYKQIKFIEKIKIVSLSDICANLKFESLQFAGIS